MSLREHLVGKLRGALMKVSGLAVINDKLNKLSADLQRMEYFSNGTRATYIGDRRVLVRIVVGGANIAFIVEADDRLLTPWFMATGTYEEDLTRFLLGQLKPDSHCLDVGSNFGYFTCLMSRFCSRGKVIGVEADEKIYHLVRDNIAINGFEHVAQARMAAVNDTGETMTMYRRTGRSGNTSMAAASEALTNYLGEPPVTPFAVQGLRVDDLLPEFGGRLDFIKVDVEGGEPLVFRGARETIQRNPQIAILMEWASNQISHAGFDVRGFLAELEQMELQAFDIVGGVETPLSFDDLAHLPYRAGVLLRRH